MRLKQGKDFTTDDVLKEGYAQNDVLALVDGRIIGGMSYAIDRKLKQPPEEDPKGTCA